jgi:hypothetical protein
MQNLLRNPFSDRRSRGNIGHVSMILFIQFILLRVTYSGAPCSQFALKSKYYRVVSEG